MNLVEEVLAQHTYESGGGPPRVCACGHWMKPGPTDTLQDVHRRHLAEVLTGWAEGTEPITRHPADVARVSVEIDVFLAEEFDDLDLDDVTAEQVAVAGWEMIGDWWDQGYMPYVEVTMRDGSKVTIDTEQAVKDEIGHD